MNRENFCDIYVARIPTGEIGYETLYPENREIEVSGVRNERVRREKYCVWRLFEHALKESRGIDIRSLKIKKRANGKWCAEGVEFSLTHTKNAVAVAISNAPVGIDLEPLSALKNDISKRILTECELSEYKKLKHDEKYLIKMWTAKEAVFKASDEAMFRPETLEVSDYPVIWKELNIDGERYFCALFSETCDEPRLFFLD